MTCDDTFLGVLADELVPASNEMPPASRAGVPGAGLDFVLGVRPELIAPLDALLCRGRGEEPGRYVRHLRESDPDAFSVLSLVVVGGYLHDAQVQRLLGYTHRIAAPLDEPDPTDAFEAELLGPVRAAGRRYRQTPATTGDQSRAVRYANLTEPP